MVPQPGNDQQPLILRQSSKQAPRGRLGRQPSWPRRTNLIGKSRSTRPLQFTLKQPFAGLKLPLLNNPGFIKKTAQHDYGLQHVQGMRTAAAVSARLLVLERPRGPVAAASLA